MEITVGERMHSSNGDERLLCLNGTRRRKKRLLSVRECNRSTFMRDSFALMGEGVGLKLGILMRSIFELRKFIDCQEKARIIFVSTGD